MPSGKSMEKRINDIKLHLLLFFYLLGSSTLAQDLETIRAMWKNKMYDQILPILANYQPKNKAETSEVDYLFASSLCRVDNKEENADGIYYWNLILKCENLDNNNKNIVLNEIQNCGSKSNPMTIVIDLPQSTAGLHGTKMMYDPDLTAIANIPSKIIREIPDSVINKRLFSNTEIDKGKTFFKQILPTYYQFGDSSFRVLSKMTFTLEQQRKILETLNLYLNFYLAKYKLTKPTYIITVYLAKTKDELRDLSDKLYGIEVSQLAIGFSNPRDYSLIAISTGNSISSSAFHELFHVISNNSPGIIPSWLEEGIASIYEWSKIESKTSIIGLNDWRGDILRDFHIQAPHINELVEMDWSKFNCEQQKFDPHLQAINYAIARYFAMYLDKTQVIADYYNRISTIDIDYIKLHPNDFPTKLLEDVLGGKSIIQIDIDFKIWLQTEYNIFLYN
jgi:hypothetical protein